jgi:hypothetical protein
MIGKVIFEGKRDRRQIKNKFKREERENPTSVDQVSAITRTSHSDAR